MQLLIKNIGICLLLMMGINTGAQAQGVERYKDHHIKGRALLESGDIDGAIEQFSIAIEIMPYYSGLYQDRGNARMLKGDYELAIDDFNSSLDKNPYKTNVYQLRGIAFYNLHAYERARIDFLKVLKDQPYNKYAQDYLNDIDIKLNRRQQQNAEATAVEVRERYYEAQRRKQERDKVIWGVVVPMAVWTAIAWSWYQ